MSSYAPPANFNPIFNQEKFISIPTANVDTTGAIYRNALTIANNTLDEATEVLTEFSTSATIPSAFPVPRNTETPIISYTFAPGCWLWTINFCCDVPQNFLWTSISVWITTTIGSVVRNQQSCNYYNYNTTTQGTIMYPTLNTTFMVNNNTTDNCSAVVKCIIKCPAGADIECWFGAVYFGSGFQEGKIIITDNKNPFQV
jgi:hypothetical protein